MKKFKKYYKIMIVFFGILLVIEVVPTLCRYILDSGANKVVTIWDGSIASTFSGGSGSSRDPFRIQSASELALMTSAAYATGGYHFELEQDLYLNLGILEPNYLEGYDLLEFPHIQEFNGYLEGNHHTIYGLYAKEGSWIHTVKGTIQNLKILNGYIEGPEPALIERMEDATLEKCIWNGTIVDTKAMEEKQTLTLTLMKEETEYTLDPLEGESFTYEIKRSDSYQLITEEQETLEEESEIQEEEPTPITIHTESPLERLQIETEENQDINIEVTIHHHTGASVIKEVYASTLKEVSLKGVVTSNGEVHTVSNVESSTIEDLYDKVNKSIPEITQTIEANWVGEEDSLCLIIDDCTAPKITATMQDRVYTGSHELNQIELTEPDTLNVQILEQNNLLKQEYAVKNANEESEELNWYPMEDSLQIALSGEYIYYVKATDVFGNVAITYTDKILLKGFGQTITLGNNDTKTTVLTKDTILSQSIKGGFYGYKEGKFYIKTSAPIPENTTILLSDGIKNETSTLTIDTYTFEKDGFYFYDIEKSVRLLDGTPIENNPAHYRKDDMYTIDFRLDYEWILEENYKTTLDFVLYSDTILYQVRKDLIQEYTILNESIKQVKLTCDGLNTLEVKKGNTRLMNVAISMADTTYENESVFHPIYDPSQIYIKIALLKDDLLLTEQTLISAYQFKIGEEVYTIRNDGYAIIPLKEWMNSLEIEIVNDFLIGTQGTYSLVIEAFEFGTDVSVSNQQELPLALELSIYEVEHTFSVELASESILAKETEELAYTIHYTGELVNPIVYSKVEHLKNKIYEEVSLKDIITKGTINEEGLFLGELKEDTYKGTLAIHKKSLEGTYKYTFILYDGTNKVDEFSVVGMVQP